jgi:hypothetical protein
MRLSRSAPLGAKFVSFANSIDNKVWLSIGCGRSVYRSALSDLSSNIPPSSFIGNNRGLNYAQIDAVGTAHPTKLFPIPYSLILSRINLNLTLTD